MTIRQLSDDRLTPQEIALLTKISETKVSLSGLSLGGAFFASSIAGYFLYKALPDSDILIWPLLIGMALLLRLVVISLVRRHLRNSDSQRLLQSQWSLLCSSLLFAAVIGSGLWFAGPAPTLEVSLSITAVIVFCFFGIMAILGNDFKSFAMSAPFMIIQPMVFWAGASTEGNWVAVSLFGLLVLGLVVGWQISKNFRDSIAIRFDKDRLVEELNNSQQATLAALDEARQANTEKAFFMASASHDLRQPLFAIQMVNETMLLQKPPENVENLLKIQAKSINAMTKLFNNLLDLAQFDSHKIACTIVDFNLRDVQATMCEEFATLARAKGLKFRYDLPDVVVRSDFDLVGRVLRNIISNAINYTPSGEVVISGNIFDDRVMVSVHDTGSGIHESEHRRIFAEFVQLPNQSRSLETGLGVGLAIVKQIDSMLGLNLELRSAPGIGSTFSFCLTQAPAGQGVAG